jgi:hypothetical protein
LIFSDFPQDQRDYGVFSEYTDCIHKEYGQMKKGYVFGLILVLATGIVPGTVSAETTVLRDDRVLSTEDGLSGNDRPEKVYKITAGKGDRVVVRVSSLDFDPLVRLIAGESETVSEARAGVAVLSSRIQATDGVRIAVSSRPGTGAETGSYSIRVEVYPPDSPIQPGETRYGNLQFSSERYDSNRYIEWHDIEVRSGEVYLVLVESEQIDTYLILRFPDGTEISNDDYSGTDAGVLFAATADGAVQLGATSFMSEALGEYRVRVSRMKQPEPIEIGEIVHGALQDDAGPEHTGALYRLTGWPGATVRITLESDEFDTVLRIRDSLGYAEENDDASELGTNSRLLYTFETDTFLDIVVAGFYGAVGSYRLLVEEHSEPDYSELVDGHELSPGETVFGLLGHGSGEYRSGIAQRFTCSVETGEEILVDLASSAFDPFLTLVTPSGREFTDDDGGDGVNSRLSVSAPESGTYQIFASSYDGTGTGAYEITLSLAPPMNSLLTIDGYLSPGAPRSPDGYLFRNYQFDAESGDRIVIDLVSDEFDTYLELHNPDGVVIAENDDHQGSSNSRLDVTIPVSGRYSVVVRGFLTDPGGNFHLTVRQ